MLSGMDGQRNYRVDIYDGRHILIASRRFAARSPRAALAAGSALVASLGGKHGAVLEVVCGVETYVDSVEAGR